MKIKISANLEFYFTTTLHYITCVCLGLLLPHMYLGLQVVLYHVQSFLVRVDGSVKLFTLKQLIASHSLLITETHKIHIE